MVTGGRVGRILRRLRRRRSRRRRRVHAGEGIAAQLAGAVTERVVLRRRLHRVAVRVADGRIGAADADAHVRHARRGGGRLLHHRAVHVVLQLQERHVALAADAAARVRVHTVAAVGRRRRHAGRHAAAEVAAVKVIRRCPPPTRRRCASCRRRIRFGR